MAWLYLKFTLINDIAATVSVAHRTELIIRISVKVKASKNRLFIRIMIALRHKNPMIVPMIPRNATTPKF
jgi:hypothetical protein